MKLTARISYSWRRSLGSITRFGAVAICLALSLTAPAESYKLKLHKIIDPGTKMLVGTYLVPAGWTAKDEITWMPLNYGTPCVGKSTVTNPDGTMSLVRVSAISVPYGQSTFGRNGMFPPESIAQHLGQLWSNENPGVPYQIVAKEESPIERHTGQYQTYGYDGAVKLAFDKDGRHMVVKGYARIDGFQTLPVGSTMVMEGRWTISNIIGATAPADKLAAAMKLYGICLTSFEMDPRFFNVVLQVQKWSEEHAYQESENALELSRHIAQNQRAISADIMGVYQNREKAMDGMNEKFDDYIRGLNTYTDTNGTKIKLPNYHSHLYSNGVGDYFYSDKPGGATGNFHEIKKN